MTKRFSAFNLLEAAPLMVFIILYKVIDPTTPQDWLTPYLAGTTVAIFATLVVLARGLSLNSILIGINIYLITGCLGLLTRQTWLIRVYGDLEASGMLAWVIVVGVFSVLFSPSGFIDVDSGSRKTVVTYSVCLLAVAIVAFSMAYYFRGYRMFAESVPFAFLFVAYGVFRSRANSQVPTARDQKRRG